MSELVGVACLLALVSRSFLVSRDPAAARGAAASVRLFVFFKISVCALAVLASVSPHPEFQ